MPHGHTRVKLDWIRINSSQNMLNFAWIDGMTLPLPLAKVHNSQT